MPSRVESFAGIFRRDRSPAVEQLVIREIFTPEESEAIEANNGLIYHPTGLTIRGQIEAQETKNKPAFFQIQDSDINRLMAVPSRQVQVAIFPEPADFFVPGSFNKNVATQERMAAEDAKRLGLPNVTQIIPNEASTLTEVVFQHLDATGQWLFGPKYAAAQGLWHVFGRTKNSTHFSWDAADVGQAYPHQGVCVENWFRLYGLRNLGAVRMVVPIEIK